MTVIYMYCSHNIYLIHAPLLQLISKFIIIPLHINALNSFFIFMLLGNLFLIATSYIFYLLAEHSFTKTIKEIRVAV